MYLSTEIRWFTKIENQDIISWFARHGMNINSVQARTDYYLMAHDYSDFIPKLREGRIEIKHKVGSSSTSKLTHCAEGYLEQFVKWSFLLDSGDEISGKIINFNYYDSEWIEVYKERMGVKIAETNEGIVKIYDITEVIESGCQIEYTKIKVKNQVWYSFNFEWFGNEFLNLDSAFLAKLFGTSKWKLKDSMNYGKFLKNFDS
jgi:hypothetical protein